MMRLVFRASTQLQLWLTLVTIRFRAIGNTPILTQKVARVSGDQKFSILVKYLRKTLRLPPNESIFCYVNLSFSPGLDDILDNLYKVRKYLWNMYFWGICGALDLQQTFATGDELIIAYCTTAAFG
jgi:ubiquitin-like protein ATG12